MYLWYETCSITGMTLLILALILPMTFAVAWIIQKVALRGILWIVEFTPMAVSVPESSYSDSYESESLRLAA
jgi:hypothetical protein